MPQPPQILFIPNIGSTGKCTGRGRVTEKATILPVPWVYMVSWAPTDPCDGSVGFEIIIVADASAIAPSLNSFQFARPSSPLVVEVSLCIFAAVSLHLCTPIPHALCVIISSRQSTDPSLRNSSANPKRSISCIHPTVALCGAGHFPNVAICAAVEPRTHHVVIRSTGDIRGSHRKTDSVRRSTTFLG
jgi:hypothetical protein